MLFKLFPIFVYLAGTLVVDIPEIEQQAYYVFISNDATHNMVYPMWNSSMVLGAFKKLLSSKATLVWRPEASLYLDALLIETVRPWSLGNFRLTMIDIYIRSGANPTIYTGGKPLYQHAAEAGDADALSLLLQNEENFINNAQLFFAITSANDKILNIYIDHWDPPESLDSHQSILMTFIEYARDPINAITHAMGVINTRAPTNFYNQWQYIAGNPPSGLINELMFTNYTTTGLYLIDKLGDY
jgi:hypothetical protein